MNLPSPSAKTIFIAIFTLFFLFSCHDDDIIMPSSDFSDCVKTVGETAINIDSIVDYSCISSNRVTMANNFIYSFTRFNPSNSNEIVFMKHPESQFTNCNHEIWTYNFCTDEISFVTDQVCYGIDWSIKGWIVFTGTDRQIYKIKSNGDSLIRLTDQAEFNNYAEWNSSGDRFVYRASGDSGNTMTIADQKGNTIDVLSNLFADNWRWRGDSLVYSRIHSDKIEYGFYDISRQRSIVIDTFFFSSAYEFINDIIYLPNSNSIYYQSSLETVIVNLDNGQQRTILTGADNRRYLWSDVSPDEKYVISTRWDYLGHTSVCRYDAERTIHIVDIDGGNERKITIPE